MVKASEPRVSLYNGPGAKPSRPVGAVALLERILAGTPQLPPSIPCRSHHPTTFDGGDPAINKLAIEICGGCVARAQCRAWASAQPPGTIAGVCGGKIWH
jgi:hypothetical protein